MDFAADELGAGNAFGVASLNQLSIFEKYKTDRTATNTTYGAIVRINVIYKGQIFAPAAAAHITDFRAKRTA